MIQGCIVAVPVLPASATSTCLKSIMQPAQSPHTPSHDIWYLSRSLVSFLPPDEREAIRKVEFLDKRLPPPTSTGVTSFPALRWVWLVPAAYAMVYNSSPLCDEANFVLGRCWASGVSPSLSRVLSANERRDECAMLNRIVRVSSMHRILSDP